MPRRNGAFSVCRPVGNLRRILREQRSVAKSYGERLRGCNVRDMNPQKADGLSPELQTALQPLLAGIESLSERIRECNERIEQLAQES